MMFAFLCRRAILRRNGFFCKPFSSLQSSSDVGLLQSSSLTASYLTTSCGLSSDVALSLSEKFSIKSTKRSDDVLELLRDYGFTNSQISRLVSAWPQVLVACPKKTLTPKLEFFSSIGVAQPVLTQKLSSFPGALHRSLKRYTIPYYSFLKSILPSDDLVARVFLCGPSSFKSASRANSFCNMALLRERGVPESWIVSFFVNHPFIMNIGSEKFADCVHRVVEIGISSSKFKFLDALQVFANMSETTLKRKKETYKSYGWSETDVSAAFPRHPLCLALSEKKIKENMDFLVNVMGLGAADVVRCPVIMGMSLEKRLKPRFSVIRVLRDKGILKEKPTFTSLFIMSEEKFVQKFIVKYQEDVAWLLEFYKGKLSIGEMGFP